MSPASKSKSKDKKSNKDPPKGSLKHALHINTSSGAPASGYNPLSGTFHTFDTSPIPTSSLLQTNIRFRNMDDLDDPNLSLNGTEYDSVSNNGSWSGESEDHREKPLPPSHPRPELSVPGADNDKREKIRLKNERKHQRQKERRAQELHERCTGYLMSRKLEALSQQLVSMGFPQERATMALILNEGRVEESVAWLFEGGEEENNRQEAQNLCNGSGSNLKIDISEEQARLAEMEVRFKASKQEVERAVVSCEGDLRRADEMLRAQKEEEQSPAAPPKPEQVVTGDPPSVGNNRRQQPLVVNQNPVRVQSKPIVSLATQHRRDDKDFNYTKLPPVVGPSLDLGAKSVQVLKKAPPKPDWTKQQQAASPGEKQWSGPSASAGLHNNIINNNSNNNNNNATSFSISSSPLLASPPPAKTEPPRFLVIGNELKNLQLGSVKEPVIVMRRPQQSNTTPKLAQAQTQAHSSSTSLGSSPPGTNSGWYSNSAETLRPNGLVPSFAVSGGFNPEIVSSNPMYSQFLYQQRQQQQYGSNSRGLAAASSLGLFSGLGTNGGPSGSVDWQTGGSILQCDYANVDWSLDRGLLQPRPSGLWARSSHPAQNIGYGVKSGVRPVLPGGMAHVLPEGDSSSREWSSPFEEKDIFSLPRQYVSSPSL